MARQTGVSAAFLSSVETGAGRGLPSEETIRRWAKVLGAHVNVDALICAAGRLPEDVVAWYCADPDRLRHVRARMERDAAGG